MAIVRYVVSDVQKSIDFYASAFGFEEVERWGPAFAIVQMGDLQLLLSGPNTSAAAPMPDGRVPEPGGWNRIVVNVTEIRDTVSKLQTLGAAFRNDVITGPGGSQVLVEDPDGNPIEVFQPRD